MVHQKTKSRLLKVNGTAIRYTNKPITSWGGLTVIMGGFFEKIDFKALGRIECSNSRALKQ